MVVRGQLGRSRAARRRKVRAQWRLDVLTRDGWTCRVQWDDRCTGPNDVQAHHVKPRDLGGGDTLENGLAACLRCHGALHANITEARRRGVLKASWE